jgi:hypothetical protein
VLLHRVRTRIRRALELYLEQEVIDDELWEVELDDPVAETECVLVARRAR